MFNKPVFYTLDGTATILDIPPNTSTGEQTIDVITSPNDIVVTNYDNRNYIPIVEGLPFPAGLDWSFIVRNEFLDGNGNIIFVSSPRSNAGVGSPPSFANPLDDIPNLNIGEGELLGPAVLMENGFTFRTRYIINNQTTLTFRLRWNANATIDWELVGLEEF